MPTKLTADLIVGHDLYAKGNVKAWDGTLTKVVREFKKGDLIGKVYSWIRSTNGSIYWMFYFSQDDYNNFRASYVKQDGNLSLPDKEEIMSQLEAEEEKKKREEKGLIPYYIEKYAPYIVGGVIVVAAAPSLIGSLRKRNSSVSGTSGDYTGLALLLGLSGAIFYLKYKKRKAGPLLFDFSDPGEYVKDNSVYQPPIQNNSTQDAVYQILPGDMPASSNTPKYVGPFAVISGRTARGDLGSVRIF